MTSFPQRGIAFGGDNISKSKRPSSDHVAVGLMHGELGRAGIFGLQVRFFVMVVTSSSYLLLDKKHGIRIFTACE